MHTLKNALLLLFLVSASCGYTSPALSEDSIPVPPRRPDILNVSPAYIEQLMNRNVTGRQDQNLADITPSGHGDREHDDLDHLVDLNKADILDILDNKQVKHVETLKKTVPIPSEKPKTTEELEDDKTTLVSFALKPDQVALDKNLEGFLQTHAINLFTENKGLTMEIHAYAQAAAGQQHSDVRVSLARALEVRSFLIQRDIAPSRLKIMPMGRDANNDSHNRIDLIFIAP